MVVRSPPGAASGISATAAGTSATTGDLHPTSRTSAVTTAARAARASTRVEDKSGARDLRPLARLLQMAVREAGHRTAARSDMVDRGPEARWTRDIEGADRHHERRGAERRAASAAAPLLRLAAGAVIQRDVSYEVAREVIAAPRPQPGASASSETRSHGGNFGRASSFAHLIGRTARETRSCVARDRARPHRRSAQGGGGGSRPRARASRRANCSGRARLRSQGGRPEGARRSCGWSILRKPAARAGIQRPPHHVDARDQQAALQSIMRRESGRVRRRQREDRAPCSPWSRSPTYDPSRYYNRRRARDGLVLARRAGRPRVSASPFGTPLGQPRLGRQRTTCPAPRLEAVHRRIAALSMGIGVLTADEEIRCERFCHVLNGRRR